MIEHIHLHIPKTAGRSYFRVLNSVYGENVEGPVNDNSYFKNDPACATKVVNVETRDQIRELNSRDVRLYEMAKVFRKKKIDGINTGVESMNNIKSTLNG